MECLAVVVVDGREEMVSKHRPHRSLAQNGLDYVVVERRRKDKVEAALASTS